MDQSTKMINRSLFGALVGLIVYGAYFLLLCQRFGHQGFGAVENITQMLLVKFIGGNPASLSEMTRPLLWYFTISTSSTVGAAIGALATRGTQSVITKYRLVLACGIYGVGLMILYLGSLWIYVLAPASPKFSDTFVSGLLLMYGPLLFMSVVTLVAGVRLLLMNKKFVA